MSICVRKSEKELKKLRVKIQQLADKSGVYGDDKLHKRFSSYNEREFKQYCFRS